MNGGLNMQGRGTTVVLMIGLGLGLAGCQGVLHKLGLKHDNKVMARAIAPDRPAGEISSTDAGRKLLDAGQPGNAIEAFQRALASGEPVAPALNGLGVAYARLGRLDLAHRYFQEAVVIAPGEARFAENLSRLVRSPAYAVQLDAAPTPQEMAIRQALADTGRIERLSSGEVRVRTVEPMAAPVAKVGFATASPDFVPLVRIPLDSADNAPANQVADKPAAQPAPTLRRIVRPVAVSAGFRPLVRIPMTSPQVAGMQRISRGEVHIVTQSTVPPARAPAARVAVRDSAGKARPAGKGQSR